MIKTQQCTMTIAFLVFVAPFAGCVTVMHGLDMTATHHDSPNAAIICSWCYGTSFHTML